MSELDIKEYKHLLKELVSFETVAGNHNEFERAIEFLQNYADKHNLIVTKYQNYLLIENNNEVPKIEFFTHLDVVPVEGQKWETDPFQLVEKDDKYYGRGVIDDKGPMAAILLLLKNSQLSFNIRLFIGFHEETTFECIKEYNGNHSSPKLGIVSDAKFPVIFGEKGSAHFKVVLPKLVEVVNTTNSTNTVVDTFYTDDRTYTGRASHSSKAVIEDNAIYKFLKDYYPEQFGTITTFNENKLGYTIYNPTTVKSSANSLEVYFDVRYTKIEHLDRLSASYGVEVVNTKPAKYCYDESIVNLLMNCYQSVTNDFDNKARTSTAGTYSSYLDNTYVFGFAMPGEEGNVHLTDEHINIETVIKGYNIYYKLLNELEKEGD